MQEEAGNEPGAQGRFDLGFKASMAERVHGCEGSRLVRPLSALDDVQHHLRALVAVTETFMRERRHVAWKRF